jgi:2-polyprenyl-3-methyl-5-hydroxy-6-metoxy-1,4-benzoquinol methylase
MKCRHCQSRLKLTLIDLGSAPPSNAYLTALTMRRPEKWFPLKILICENCWLVQTEDYSRASELFTDEYAYFSSFSDSWVRHAQEFVASAVSRFDLGKDSYVIELASNDGYLLQHVQALGIPCLGIEPTASTANAARLKGLEVIERFFGLALAEELRQQGRTADLVVGINVLAHVPDINDFVGGVGTILKPNGVCSFEFPHILNLITQRQFDTIYHEHFSYLAFSTVCQILARSGLQVFDVEKLDTHGGSLRVLSQLGNSGAHQVSSSVSELLDLEEHHKTRSVGFYENFAQEIEKIKVNLLAVLVQAKSAGKKVAAYGAAAKGNTILNYAGVRPDLISFVVDRNSAKQGKWMPGSRIPIVNEDYLKRARPDIIIILPWNLREEILEQLEYARTWGAQFLITQPRVQFIE